MKHYIVFLITKGNKTTINSLNNAVYSKMKNFINQNFFLKLLTNIFTVSLATSKN